MANPTPTKTTGAAPKTGQRTGYWIACETMPGTPADCGFQLRNENRNQLVKLTIQHAKESHGKAMSEADLAPGIKTVKF